MISSFQIRLNRTCIQFAIAFVIAGFAQAADFTGRWDTTWGDSTKTTRLVMTEKNGKVTGNYKYLGGVVSGTVEDGTLKGTWYQKSNGVEGDFIFVLSDDGKSFKGRWRTGHKGGWAPDSWNGVRAD